MAQYRDGADALPTHNTTPVEDQTTEHAHDVLLAMLATHTGQIVWVCDAAGLVTWEAGWCAYTGLTPDGVVGMRWLNVVHPDDVSASMQVWAHALETRQPYEVQQRLLRADGAYRVFRSRAMPVPHDDGTVHEWVGVSVDITEFTESAAERELALTRERTAWAQREDAHRRLLMALESTTDQVLIVDREWRITYINETAALEAGVNRSDYVGYNLFEKSPGLLGSEFERGYRRALAEQASVEFEAWHPVRATWFAVHVYPWEDGVAVYYRDITETKRYKDEFRQHKEDLRAFLTRVPLGVVRVDAQGRISHANPAFCTLLGYSIEELTTRRLADLHLPDDDAHGPQASADVLGAEERRLRRKDGTVAYARVIVTELTDAQGRSRAILYALEDVTELRRLQWALAEVNASRDEVGDARASGEVAAPVRQDTPVRLVADAQVLSPEEDISYCPTCDKPLVDAFFINPAGELVGCPDCADERELAGATLSRDEWLGPMRVLGEVLARFGLPTGAQARKPTLTPARRPNAHSWDVLAPEGSRYHLRRFSGWYPDDAVEFHHSLMTEVAATGLPVPHVLRSRDGREIVEANGMRWALYRALEGHVTAESEWQWLRPKAAELLGQLHVALEYATPKGASFALWGAWDFETLDRVLASWPPHPELTDDLIGFIREQLATRYFADLYPVLPKQVVHGAFGRENMLWLGDGLYAQGSGILAFEQAHVDTVLVDLAAGVGSIHPPVLRATVAAYTAVRTLTAEEREALPEALLLDAVRRLDRHVMYLHDLEEIGAHARALQGLVRNLDVLRQVVAPRGL